MSASGALRDAVARLRRAVVGVSLANDVARVYDRERRARNQRTLRGATAVLFLVHLATVAVYWRDLGPGGAPEDFHATVCAIHLGVLPVVMLVAALAWRARPLERARGGPDVLALAFSGLYVALGVALSVNAQRLNGNLNVYSAALISNALLLRHGAAATIALPALGLAGLIAGVVSVQPDPDLRVAAISPAVAVAALAVLVARLTDDALRGAVVSRETIERQRAELAASRDSLEELNRDLEQRVERQVDEIVRNAREIEKLNHHLRAQVMDRSRQLAQALREAGPRTRAPLVAGEVLDGRVEIGTLVGGGAMGDVYRGHDRILDRAVAVKIPRPDSGVSTDVWVRFAAEAEAAAAVHHPVVVPTLHVGISDDGRLYQLQELVDGVTLASTIEHGATWPAAEAARIGAAVADALAAAHAGGVVHRDVKPGNVMVSRRAPGVRLLDFGISKLHGSARGTDDTGPLVVGTPPYLAPEQITTPERVGPPADVYALSAMIYELIVGAPPFVGSAAALMHQHIHDPPRPLPEARAPAALIALIDRGLAKDPAARPSAPAFAAELTAIADAGGALAAEALTPPAPPAPLAPNGATLRLQRTT